MTLETLRSLLAARPFEPFRVVMSSGESYEIPHPEMAWLTRTNLYVGIGTTRQGVPASARICSLLHIASVEPIVAAESK